MSPPKQLGGLVAGLPLAEVVGDPGHDVGVGVDLAEVDVAVEHRRGARLGEAVVDRQVHEVAVHGRRHPHRIGVPVEDVEGLRGVAEQVVVDPVVPDQVVGSQPREHLGQHLAVEVALLRRRPGRGGRGLVREQRAGQPGLLLVEHGHREAERRDPVEVTGGGEVGEHHRGEHAARADAEQGDLVLARDLLGRRHRLDDRLAVGVQPPVGVPGVGVAPGDAVDLLAAGDEVLDQAALLGEVDHVVLVDRRRHDQQRDLADLGGLRGVLDQLEDVGAQHHLTRVSRRCRCRPRRRRARPSRARAGHWRSRGRSVGRPRRGCRRRCR